MKAPLEKDITRQIRSYLNMRGIWHFKVWQGLGSVKGVADIIGIYNGAPLAIEVKTAKGKLSEHQERFLTRWKNEGGIAIVARSVEDVEDGLQFDN